MHITVDLSGLQHGLWYVAKRFVEAVGLCYFDSFTLKTLASDHISNDSVRFAGLMKGGARNHI